MNFSDRLSGWAPYAIAALRIVAALLFLEHGLMKIAAFPVPQPGSHGHLSLLLQIAGWLEIGGGAALVVGFIVRPVAFLLCGQMAVAYFMAHAPQAFWPAVNKGESAILFCFIFLVLIFTGSGAFALDRLMARRSNHRG